MINKIHSIFPTAIGEYSSNISLSEKEILKIEQLPKIRNIGNFTSKSNYVFQEIAELNKLYEFCHQSCNHFFHEVYKPMYSTEIYITQSWLNYTNVGEWHQPHNHTNSIISGVIYLQCSNNDSISFLKMKGFERLTFRSREKNAFNSEFEAMNCSVGKLYLFDSMTSHCVEVREDNFEKKTRISLSFNTFMRGKLGEALELNELYLR